MMPKTNYINKNTLTPLRRLAKSRSHVIFNDPALNSHHTIYKNVYENLLVTAMKMHYYLRSWKHGGGARFLMGERPVLVRRHAGLRR